MPRSTRISLRTAEPHDARHIHALITANLVEGHLLPRTLEELTVHVSRFVVATRGRKVVGCSELAPLSPQVAEVRSLAVDTSARHHGVGTMLVEEPRVRASREGYDQLCAFTYDQGYFFIMDFQ